MKKIIIFFITLQILISGCSKSSGSADTASSNSSEVDAVQAPAARILPTLYPTATSPVMPEPTDTRLPSPTSPPETPVNFEQPVIELRYSIPVLGLERMLEGDVSGRLKLTDESTGSIIERRNQAGILIEMQQSLPRLALDPVPDGCDGCVWIEYNLPLTGDTDQGWLQDVRMLASVENFTTALLGPHFPPGTVLGLRRSATQNQVAHSVALSSDGRLWSWKATEAEVSEPVRLEESDPILSVELGTAALVDLAPAYSADCPGGAGIETLFYRSEETDLYVQIVCPELALPSALLPIYLSLDAKTTGLFTEDEDDADESTLPQETVLRYRNADGTQLTIYYDGRTFVQDVDGAIVTDTITVTMAVSLTEELLDSRLLQTGLDVFLSGETENVLVVRGPDGLYAIGWDDVLGPSIEPVIVRLEWLIDRITTSLEGPDSGEGTPAAPEEQSRGTPTSEIPSTETPLPQNTATPS